MMPIMTGGLSVLPASLTSAGRRSTRLLSGFPPRSGWPCSPPCHAQQAQFMADRSQLLQSQGPAMDPRILEMQQQGRVG